MTTASGPNVPEFLKTSAGWNQFAGAFLIGGVGGAIFAYFIINNLDLLKAIATGSI